MSYAVLEQHHRKLSHLKHVAAFTAWDEATNMPAGGGEARAEAMATLQGLIHEQSTRPELADWLAGAEAHVAELEPWQAANLREMKRAHQHASAVPQSLVEATTRATLRSEQAWRSLRAQNDWAAFRPLLEEVVTLKRESAQALSAALNVGLYDALLDEFEPFARVSQIDPIFTRLREFLPSAVARATERSRSLTRIVPQGPFSTEVQRALGQQLMKRVGFDFSHGRLDTSHHPFCGGVPQDVRITTRYDEADFAKALMGVLHETGHAKYEQNLPQAWIDQPVGAARGMSMHESQSLLLEMQVCRSREFTRFVAPILAEAFASASAANPEAFTEENLYRLATRVEPGFIRVDADEVTYPCHILLRYEIERPLIEGKLEVKDIPESWDRGMQSLLGLSTHGNDRDGCMQDVHWPAGLFGYFPTYTLGALTAAQLFRAARRAVPGLLEQIARGEFGGLDGWLRTNVWGVGSSLSTNEILARATGSTLNTQAFEEHVARRYLG
ncbi:MAG TPA: carboxypeptidase M32 [Polyangiaceae bacterium]|nr:carboxypeptidase M32 [Polyangiaceae bacterium]